MLICTGILLLVGSCKKKCSTEEIEYPPEPFSYDRTYSKIVKTNWQKSYILDSTISIRKSEYYLDELGRVYRIVHSNLEDSTIESTVDSFSYDTYNRLRLVYRNGKVIRRFYWVENEKVVLRECSDLEIDFSGQKIRSFGNRDDCCRIYCEYDGENVIRLTDKEGNLVRDYLEYQLDLIHPEYYFKSIELVIFLNGSKEKKPVCRNICKALGVPPFWDDDYGAGYRTYEFLYEVDSIGRVVELSIASPNIYFDRYEYIE